MLSQNIKTIRKQKGYTQETLAQELNVVRQTVSKWEKGYSVPDAIMLEKIADLLEVPVSALLGAVEEKEDGQPDLRQISEQLSVLNNQLAKELLRKRRNRRIALVVCAVLIAVVVLLVIIGLFPHQQMYIDAETNRAVACVLDPALEEALSREIISSHQPAGSERGECTAESHFVFGNKETNDTVTVYLLEEYARFGFQNGFFTDVGGGRTPAVYSFRKTDDGYTLLSKEYAKDGSYYVPSIKELFPHRWAKQILRGLPQEVTDLMWQNLAKQAVAYLHTINRKATVCLYSELDIEQLSDYGIETEIGNKISEMKWKYDDTIGNHETIENGVRYVYQTAYDANHDWITFTKFEYETNKIVDFTAVDADSGEVVKNAPTPENVTYYVGRLSSESDS